MEGSVEDDWRRGLRPPPPPQSPARGCGLHAGLTIIGRPWGVMPQVGEVKQPDEPPEG
jgi:hypothetical protein